MRAVVVMLVVPLLFGCAVSPNSSPDLELGASALQARATSDAALSAIQVATAARLATRNTLDDYSTRQAAEAFRVQATQTREAVEMQQAMVEKTESAAMGATVQARLATYQAQTPTARAIANATGAAMAHATETMRAERPTQTRIAEIAEDAARVRAETIQREQDTAQFRTVLGMVQDVVWAVFPFAVGVVLSVLLGYGLARILYAGELFLRTAAANRRIVYNGDVPVLYFLPNGSEYEILDPKLLPQTAPVRSVELLAPPSVPMRDMVDATYREQKENEVVGGFIHYTSLRAFVETILETNDWTQSTWADKTLPRGYVLSKDTKGENGEIVYGGYSRLLSLFVESNLIINRRRGSAGAWNPNAPHDVDGVMDVFYHKTQKPALPSPIRK